VTDSATAPPPRGALPERARRQARRRHTATAVTVVLLAVLVVLGLTKVNRAEVGHALARVDGWWLAGAAALMAAAFLARAESWYGALRVALPDERIGRPAVTRALLIGMAGSAVAPGRLGEAARAWLIARRAGRVRDALATVVGTVLAQTVLNVLALVLLSAVAVGGSAIRGARTSSVLVTALVPLAGVLVLVAAPALLGRSRWVRGGRVGAAGRWIRARLVEVRQGLALFRCPAAALHSGGFQMLAWGLQWACCYVVLVAFGLQSRAGLAAAAAVLVAVNITAILPVTPSNVGVFQAACIAVLAPFHVSAGEALAYGLVLQAVEIGCALAMGLPSLLVEGVSIGELRAQANGRRVPRVSGQASRGY
jgi:uncharacterized membrane protein YbhN (UPF0104 family)